MAPVRTIFASILIIIMAAVPAGCQQGRASSSSPAATGGPSGRSARRPLTQPPPEHRLAYVNGQPVTLTDLQTHLLEAAGGKVLAEFILERMLDEELADRGLELRSDLIDVERRILAQVLDPDPDQAQRLLDELRQRRGLGKYRFRQLLRRNAALRLLVQDQVEVSPAAIQQAYDLEYGPRYEARLIVVDSLPLASQLVKRARSGQDEFVDLVIAHSTDASRAQGGLLPPISPADASFPAVVRQAVQKLDVGQVSNPLALEQGFAILKLERKIDAQPVPMNEVKDELTLAVRRRVEQMLMRQKAAAMIRKAEVVILDPALHDAWMQQKQRMLQP